MVPSYPWPIAPAALALIFIAAPEEAALASVAGAAEGGTGGGAGAEGPPPNRKPILIPIGQTIPRGMLYLKPLIYNEKS